MNGSPLDITSSQSNRGKENSNKAKWNDDQTRIFIEILLFEAGTCILDISSNNFALAKSTADNGNFKTDAWTRIEEKFKLKSGVSYTRVMLQNKFSHMKSCYNIFAQLASNSGFGWDDEKGLPTAADDVWERYIKAHPKAAPYRNKPLQYYDELKSIFSGKVATGRFALSSTTEVEATPVSDDESNDDNTTRLIAEEGTPHMDYSRKSSCAAALGKRGLDIDLTATGNKSNKKRSVASAVHRGMESVCGVLESTASRIFETNHTALAMRYFTEKFGNIYDEYQAYLFAMKLTSNPAYPSLFLEMSDAVKRRFIDEQIKKDGE